MSNHDHKCLEPEIIELAKKCPVGLILVGGPAFSGITTTAKSLLGELSKEDWAERHVDVSNRYDYNDANSETVISIEVARDPYSRLMHSALSIDPGLIFLGEIRDKAKGKWAVRSTLNGHKTLAEVHACSVSSTLKRYCEFTDKEHLGQLHNLLVVSQFLLSRQDGKKVAIREFLALDAELLRALAESDDMPKTAYILSQSYGQSFYISALKLHAEGLISDEELAEVKAMQFKYAEEAGI